MALARDEVRALVRDVELLSLESRLKEAGYSFLYAVDFAELFNYLHPFLEPFSQTAVETTWQEMVRHLIAVNYMLCGRAWDLVLLEPYAIELRNHYASVKRQVFAQMVSAALLLRDSFAETFFQDARQNQDIQELQQVLGAAAKWAPSERQAEIPKLLGILGRGVFHRLFMLMKLSEELNYRRIEARIDELQSLLRPLSDFGVEERQLPSKAQILSDPLMRVLIDQFDAIRWNKYANRIDALAGCLVTESNNLLLADKKLLLLVTHSNATHRVLAPFLVREVKLGRHRLEFPLLRYPSYVNAHLIHAAMEGDYRENLDRTSRWAGAYLSSQSLAESLPEFAQGITPVLQKSEDELVRSMVTLENLSAAADQNGFLQECLVEVDADADALVALAIRACSVLASDEAQSQLVSVLEETSSSLIKTWESREDPLREAYGERLAPKGLWTDVEKFVLPARQVLELPEAVEDLKPYLFVHFRDPQLAALARELLEDGISSWRALGQKLPTELPRILQALEQAPAGEQALFAGFFALLSQPAEVPSILSLLDRAVLSEATKGDAHARAELLFLRAMVHRLGGHYDAASRDLDAAVLLKPRQARFLKELGVMCWRRSGETLAPLPSDHSGDPLLRAKSLSEEASECLVPEDGTALRVQIESNLGDICCLLFFRDQRREYLEEALHHVRGMTQLIPQEEQWYAEYRLVRGSVLAAAHGEGLILHADRESLPAAIADLKVAAALCTRQHDRDDARERLHALEIATEKPPSSSAWKEAAEADTTE